MDGQHPCYAIHVRSRYEARIATILRLKGYDPFMPTYHVRRRWSDRSVNIELPMFPAYLLCRFDIHNRMPILCTDGVYGIVGLRNTPVAIDEMELQQVMAVAKAGLPVTIYPFRAGEPVRLEGGPLAGVQGNIIEVKKECRLVVSLSLLQRSVAVEVDREWVRPLQKRLSA